MADEGIAAGDGGIIARADANLPYPEPKIEPLVLFFRTPTGEAPGDVSPTGPLPVYDRRGSKIADLASNLPQVFGGTSYEILEISVHRMVYTASYSFTYHESASLPGQAWFPQRTQVVLKVKPPGGGPAHRLIGLDTYGDATFDLTIDEKWKEFQLSPRGRYVLGRTYTDGVIFDVHTGKTVLEGLSLHEGAFSPDDSTFAFLDQSAEQPAIVLLSLSDAQQRSIPLPAQLASKAQEVSLAAAVDQGFIFKWLSRLGDGKRHWFMAPDGHWLAFQQYPELHTFEALIGLTDEGRTLLFARLPVSDGGQLAPGLYRFDPASASDDAVEPLIVNAPPFISPAEQPVGPPFAPPSLFSPFTYARDRLFFIEPSADNNQLLARPLASSAPEIIGALGPLPADGEPWLWRIQRTSDSGMIIAVGLKMLSAMAPEVIPDPGMILLDDQGHQLFSLPWGTGRLDRTGQLFVHQPRSLDGVRRPLIIADIESRTETRHNIEELEFAVVYRTR